MLKVETSGMAAAGDRLRIRPLAWRLVLALLFGLAMGGVFAAAWLGLERAWTGKTTLVAVIVTASGAVAGIVAAGAARLVARRPAWRATAAVLCLSLGTAAFASFGLFVHGLATTAPPDDSLVHAAFFILTQAAGAAYSFAGLGAPLVLLPGLPVIVLFAALIARRPR